MSERPVYETEDDLKNEQTTCSHLKARWGVEMVKLPMKSKIDFMAKKQGAVKAFIELKNRACKRHDYPTYMLSLDKWLAGLFMSQCTGIPFFLVIDWDDEIGYLECDKVDTSDKNLFTVNMGGRSDRKDAQDIEPVVHLHISMFKTVVKHSVEESK